MGGGENLPSVNIYYNKTCYGLSVDARIVRKIFKSGGGNVSSVRELDFNEAPVWADVAFHLETPVAQVLGYAHVNILLVNAEQWISNVYDSYLEDFDAVIFRSVDDLQHFVRDMEIAGKKTDNLMFLPWCCEISEDQKNCPIGTDLKNLGIVSFLGKNEYKFEWIRDFLDKGLWESQYPPLRVYTSQPEFAEELISICNKDAITNIQIECKNLDSETINRLQWLYYAQLICSRGEGFGYGAAEAECHGAQLLLSELPVFWDYYLGSEDDQNQSESQSQPIWLPSVPIDPSTTAAPKARRGLRYQLTGPDESPEAREKLRNMIMNLIDKPCISPDERRKKGRLAYQKRLKLSVEAFQGRLWNKVLQLLEKRRPIRGNWHCPPILVPDDCPPITIVTPTRNRRKLIDIAFHNLLMTDYPLKKIEWIVIEDSDNDNSCSDKLVNFQMNCPDITLRYIPLGKREENEASSCWPVGQKRNIGIENAKNDIILFMDDDDHYPSTSFRRRVAWLRRASTLSCGKKRVTGCSTLALYDLQKGVSAVNVPPWDIPQCQRVSEATLTFFKDAWVDRKFPEVFVAEGEDWLAGREKLFFEIPPQQIIVAFSHGTNSTSRRLPDISKPNGCFWGFPGPYLRFIHGLVGIEIEAGTGTGTGTGAGQRGQKKLKNSV